jgi:hypothetical protein
MKIWEVALIVGTWAVLAIVAGGTLAAALLFQPGAMQ